jgi:hypothetical protein
MTSTLTFSPRPARAFSAFCNAECEVDPVADADQQELGEARWGWAKYVPTRAGLRVRGQRRRWKADVSGGAGLPDGQTTSTGRWAGFKLATASCGIAAEPAAAKLALANATAFVSPVLRTTTSFGPCRNSDSQRLGSICRELDSQDGPPRVGRSWQGRLCSDRGVPDNHC